jgi:hypothetical protein
MRNCLILVITIFLTAISYSADSAVPDIKFLPGKQVGKVQTDLIKEASGIVASRNYPVVFWVI